jgi:hypothetical protein
MSINTLTLAQNMTDALEKVIVQKPVTGFFADNALQAKFVGANTVLIPDMDMSGLGDYDRDTGFVQGSVTIGRTPYTLTMDRGRTFQIDAQDEDESDAAQIEPKQHVRVTGGTVYVRSGPGTEYGILLVVKKGAMLDHVATADNGWHAVVAGSVSGWIGPKYTEVVE